MSELLFVLIVRLCLHTTHGKSWYNTPSTYMHYSYRRILNRPIQTKLQKPIKTSEDKSIHANSNSLKQWETGYSIQKISKLEWKKEKVNLPVSKLFSHCGNYYCIHLSIHRKWGRAVANIPASNFLSLSSELNLLRFGEDTPSPPSSEDSSPPFAFRFEFFSGMMFDETAKKHPRSC